MKPEPGTFILGNRAFQRKTWYKDPDLRRTYLCLIFVILTSATNGYDASMVNGLQSVTPWTNYFHPTPPQLGLLGCIMSLGSLIAMPVVPYAADELGRRKAIILGCVIMIVGIALQGGSMNLTMFVIARFLIGFGVAIAQTASPLLITELVHPQHRAVFTTIYNTTWYSGSVIAAWLTLGTFQINNNWSWRIPSIAQALPSTLQLIFVWLVPESPRWEIYKGRPEVALTTLANVHANGNKNDELVQAEFREIKETLKAEQDFKQNAWSELWVTPGNRHRLVILISAGVFSQWSGNGLVSYYMKPVLDSIGVTKPKTQLLLNGLLQTVNFITAFTMSFFVERFGRRKLFLTSTAGMLVSFVIWTICAERQENTKSAAAGNAVVVMIFIFYQCYNLAWAGLLVGYTVEILPYSIRAKGMTVVFTSVGFALFFNQFVNPIALNELHWKYYIFFCVWLAVELAVVYKFYIETRNTPLEEIARHFDGDRAIVRGADATELDHRSNESESRNEREENGLKNGVTEVKHVELKAPV